MSMKVFRLVIILVGLMGIDQSRAANVVSIDGGSRITPIADVTVSGSATLVKALTTDRIALNCTNTSASVHVRWGSSAVTASTGQQLRAGGAIEIRDIGAVYMISEGASVTVSCTEELQ